MDRFMHLYRKVSDIHMALYQRHLYAGLRVNNESGNAFNLANEQD